MTYLIEQQIPNYLALLSQTEFEADNSLHQSIYDKAIQFDADGDYVTNETLIFFTHLAMYNYDFTKACLREGLIDEQQNELIDDNDNVLSFILQSDDRKAFAELVVQEAEQYGEQIDQTCADIIDSFFEQGYGE